MAKTSRVQGSDEFSIEGVSHIFYHAHIAQGASHKFDDRFRIWGKLEVSVVDFSQVATAMGTQIGTQIGIGVSHHRNPVMAGKEAAAQALTQAGIERPDFVMLFSTVGYRQPILLKSVRAATDNAPLIGCSGAGIIGREKADESNFAVTILAIKSDDIYIDYGIATGLQDSSKKVGQAVGTGIANTGLTPTEAKTLFLFLDGISPNFDAFMEGLRSQTDLEQAIPAIGGFAGDNITYKETFQYCDDQLVSDGAVWALLSGQVQVASVSSHGCTPMGNKHTVTKSDRNIVYEVDHKPVLDVLKSYLTPDEIKNWGAAAVNLGWGFDVLPQQEANNTESEQKIIRCMISKDEEAGSVNVFSDIHEGSHFWIMRRDHEQIYATAAKMGDVLLEKLGGQSPKLIFQVECDGRGKLIFREHEKLKLLNTLQSKIGPEVPWIGLYAFSEIGHLDNKNCLHNFTGVLTALY